MRPVTIQGERLRLQLAPELGAGILDLSLRGAKGLWHPVMRRAPACPNGFDELACYLFVPWSNRVAGAAFTFRGATHRLRPDWPDGTAIHGDAKDHAWQILDRSPVSARFERDARAESGRNWPWPYLARVRYEIDADELRIDLSATNAADVDVPMGLGFHPFWMRRLWDERDEVVVNATLAGRYPARGMIPTAPPRADDATAHFAAGRPLANLQLDDVFAGSLDALEIRWPASGVTARFSCSRELGHTVIYSPRTDSGGPMPWFCVEPVSMVNDAFNLLARGEPGTGTAIVAPGATFSVTWRVRFDAV